VNNSNVIALPDGRRLSFAEYGKSDGRPLLFFHGTPGSRLESPLSQQDAEALDVRLIVSDRPGYGFSDAHAGHSFLHGADDIEALLDQLGIGTCPVLGFSGGGPYAMACGYKMPERISRLGLVSSLAPFGDASLLEGMNAQSRALFGLSLADSEAFRAQITTLVTDADALYRIMTTTLPEPDQSIFAKESMRSCYQANMTEAVRHGVAGIVSDMLLYPREWDSSPVIFSVRPFYGRG